MDPYIRLRERIRQDEIVFREHMADIAYEEEYRWRVREHRQRSDAWAMLEGERLLMEDYARMAEERRYPPEEREKGGESKRWDPYERRAREARRREREWAATPRLQEDYADTGERMAEEGEPFLSEEWEEGGESEYYDPYKGWREGVDEGGYAEEEWMNAGDEEGNPDWGQQTDGDRDIAGWADNQEETVTVRKKDTADEMDVEGSDVDLAKQQSKRVFKLKQLMAIPLCYHGPHFSRNYHKFTVQVSPVTYYDVWKPVFTSIASKADSIKLNLGTKENGCSVNSVLELLADPLSMGDLMKGIILLKFRSESLTVKVEQRKAELEKEEGEPLFFPTVIRKASFKINNRAISDHMAYLMANPTKAKENTSQKQSALLLHNLPRSVDWAFLRVLFPLCWKVQLIEGEPRSASIQMSSDKLAVLHLASITGLQIDGQPIHMKTDIPQHEAVQMLQEREEILEVPEQPKKKKHRSPSDIRRNMRKREEFEERLRKRGVLPPAPQFPGVPSLLSMSFSGPGNTPARGAPEQGSNTRTPTWSTRKVGVPGGKSPNTCTVASKAPSGPGGASVTPVPQIWERPSPFNPEQIQEPGTSGKVRTQSYFRRRGARFAVHQAHLWGGDIEAAGRTLAQCSLPEDERTGNFMAPAFLLSVKHLTNRQLQELRKKVKEKVSMEEMRKAEEHWQRKRKEKLTAEEDAGQAIGDQAVGGQDLSVQQPSSEGMGEKWSALKFKSQGRIERDRQRMTDYNKRKHGSGQGNANTENSSESCSQGNRSTPTEAGRWNMQQEGTNSDPPAQQQYPQPCPSDMHHPPQQQGQYHYNQDQTVQQYSHPPPRLPLPPPPPFFKSVRQPQNQYPHAAAPKPVPPPRDQFSQPPPPKPAQSPQPQFTCPPPVSAPSSKSQYPYPPQVLKPAQSPQSAANPPIHHRQGPPSQQNSPWPAADQEEGSHGWYRPGQQQQPWGNEPAGMDGGPGNGQYAQQQYERFNQRGGTLNHGPVGQGNSEDHNAGGHQQHYGQYY